MVTVQSDTQTILATANPQRKVTPEELGWLAGFLDGEGTIGFSLGAKVGQTYRQIVPRVSVANTNMATVDHVADLIARLGVGCKVTKGVRTKSPKWKQYGLVVCMGFKRVHALLDSIRPHLFTKAEQADLVLRYVERRIAAGYKQAPYTPQDFEDVARMKVLNQKGVITLTDYTKDVELGTRSCRICNQQFTPEHISQVYCVNHKRGLGETPPGPRECAGCGMTFQPWTNRGSGQRYCTPPCRRRTEIRRHRAAKRVSEATKV